MKSLILFFCLGLCCFIACKKDNGTWDYWGEASVLKNGNVWNGKIRASQHTFSDEKVNISIKPSTGDDLDLEELYFFKVPKKAGKYPLSLAYDQPPDDSVVGARYFIGYDDLLYDVYDIAANDSTSYLEITEYNKRKDEFRGKFHVRLYRTLAGSVNVPDTLIFTEGTFHTRIDD